MENLAARFLKCVWPFWNIIHQSVKSVASSKLGKKIDKRKMLKTSNWKTFVFRLKEKARKRLVNLRDFHTRASENLLSAETYKFLNKRILLKKSAVHRNFSKSNIKPGKNKICIPILIRCKWCDRIYISWGGLPWTTKNKKYIPYLKINLCPRSLNFTKFDNNKSESIHTKQRHFRQAKNALVHESNWKKLCLNDDMLTADYFANVY